VLTVLVATFGAALPPAAAKDWTEVRIASEGARPPYNFIEGENELKGFDIDLGRELCARMKVTCTFVQRDYDRLIPDLEGNHYDAIMAAMQITDARRERIDFSVPYVRMPGAFAAQRHRKIKAATPEALKGHTIGVEEQTAHETWLTDNYTESTIKSYYSLEEAMLELANGRIDALLADKLALDQFLKQRKEAQCCKFLADVPRDPVYFGEGIGVGLRKDDAELKALFDKAIEDVVGDGTYAKIRAKYFDFEIY
jgi:polar amino acid transport system substrate-binding protein